jgi:hypothetical protein
MMRFKVGDTSIPASWLNDVARAIELPANRQRANEAQLPEGIVYVKNSTGSDVPRFGVMALTNIEILPADNPSGFEAQPVFTGTAPAAAYATRYAVARKPIASGAVGECYISGVFAAAINVVDAAHTCAAPVAGDALKLSTSGDGLAQIVWKESGTGTKWAVLRMIENPGEYDSPHSAIGSGHTPATTELPAYNTGNTYVLWDRLVPYTGTKGVAIDVLLRVEEDPESGALVKIFATLNFDSAGKLIRISVEDSDEIETEDCP